MSDPISTSGTAVLEKLFKSEPVIPQGKQSCVYLIQNRDTGHFYVGATSNSKQREIDHFKTLNGKNHRNPRLQDAHQNGDQLVWKQHSTSTSEEAFRIEKEILDEVLDTDKCYNYQGSCGGPGGGAYGKALTEKRLGQNNPFFGKTHTTESLAMISEASKKRFESQEARQVSRQVAIDEMKKPSSRERSVNGARKQWADPEFRSGFCKKIRINDTVYESAAVASRELGIGYNTIRARAQNPNNTDYEFISKDTQ